MINLETCNPTELLEALENNEIKIDLNGHFMNLKKENSWKEEAILKQLIRHFKIVVKKDSEISRKYPALTFYDPESTCNCGEILYLKILDPTALVLGYKSECPYKDGLPLQTVNIKVPTGRMIFCNFFRDEDLFDPKDKHSNKFSINQIQGRINYAKHYAENHNIGYGQMGNMSGDVYVNPAKDKVIIGDCYPEDWEDYGYSGPDPEYTQAMKEGFESKGNISMSMWRWMCIDESLLPEGMEVEERVDVNLVPGTYQVIHYYDTTPNPKDYGLFKYSTIEKI